MFHFLMVSIQFLQSHRLWAWVCRNGPFISAEKFATDKTQCSVNVCSQAWTHRSIHTLNGFINHSYIYATSINAASRVWVQMVCVCVCACECLRSLLPSAHNIYIYVYPDLLPLRFVHKSFRQSSVDTHMHTPHDMFMRVQFISLHYIWTFHIFFVHVLLFACVCAVCSEREMSVLSEIL